MWREGASRGIPGGKPVAVVRKNSARAMSSFWSDQIGASGAKSETAWRRRDLWRAEEGQDRMACSKVCGPQSTKGRTCRHQDCSMRGEPRDSFSQSASDVSSLQRTCLSL